MKKTIIFLLFLSIFGLVLTGCANKDGENNNTERKGNRMPDFGQPEGFADIKGLVTKVVGNEVTVLKIERPEGFGEKNNNENTEDGDRKQTASLGGGMTGGGPERGDRMGGANRDDIDKDAMIKKMKEMGSVEETIVIPVGIQMLKPDIESGDKPDMLEASLGDIEKDVMLNIWLDENVSDRSVAFFVLIMS